MRMGVGSMDQLRSNKGRPIGVSRDGTPRPALCSLEGAGWGKGDQPKRNQVAAQVNPARRPLVGRRTCSLGGAGWSSEIGR